VDGAVGTFLVSLVSFGIGRIRLQIVTLFNPVGGNPTFTLQTISLGYISQTSSRNLPNAPQRGTPLVVDTTVIRVSDAVWRINKLWIVFVIDPRVGVNKGQVNAPGDLGGEGIAAGTHTYFPSVALNSQGVVAHGYSASSPTTYVGAYASVGTSELACMPTPSD
jgi:hypothetical protein